MWGAMWTDELPFTKLRDCFPEGNKHSPRFREEHIIKIVPMKKQQLQHGFGVSVVHGGPDSAGLCYFAVWLLATEHPSSEP